MTDDSEILINEMTKIQHGQKVKDRFGNVYTARGQIGSTVYLEVQPSNTVSFQRAWIHRTKCFRLDPRGRIDDGNG